MILLLEWLNGGEKVHSGAGPPSELTVTDVLDGIPYVVIVAPLVDIDSQLASGVIDCGQTV